ncbi:uncharacterized protein J3R85_016248 [Psidium guajava]|nr:uncharacterized protein J3R85_016248 [Psidium guajava]
MATFLGDAASVMMKVLLRKSISMYAEFSCLFTDLASLVWSALRFSTVMARHASPPPPPSAAAASSSSASSASARRYSPILMSMAIRHRVS